MRKIVLAAAAAGAALTLAACSETEEPVAADATLADTEVNADVVEPIEGAAMEADAMVEEGAMEADAAVDATVDGEVEAEVTEEPAM